MSVTPLNVTFYKNKETARKLENSAGHKKQRFSLNGFSAEDKDLYKIAFKGKATTEKPKENCWSKKYYVVLLVQDSETNETKFIKANRNSLLKRLGLDTKESKKNLPKSNDFTAVVRARIEEIKKAEEAKKAEKPKDKQDPVSEQQVSIETSQERTTSGNTTTEKETVTETIISGNKQVKEEHTITVTTTEPKADGSPKKVADQKAKEETEIQKEVEGALSEIELKAKQLVAEDAQKEADQKAKELADAQRKEEGAEKEVDVKAKEEAEAKKKAADTQKEADVKANEEADAKKKAEDAQKEDAQKAEQEAAAKKKAEDAQKEAAQKAKELADAKKKEEEAQKEVDLKAQQQVLANKNAEKAKEQADAHKKVVASTNVETSPKEEEEEESLTPIYNLSWTDPKSKTKVPATWSGSLQDLLSTDHIAFNQGKGKPIQVPLKVITFENPKGTSIHTVPNFADQGSPVLSSITDLSLEQFRSLKLDQDVAYIGHDGKFKKAQRSELVEETGWHKPKTIQVEVEGKKATLTYNYLYQLSQEKVWVTFENQKKAVQVESNKLIVTEKAIVNGKKVTYDLGNGPSEGTTDDNIAEEKIVVIASDGKLLHLETVNHKVSLASVVKAEEEPKNEKEAENEKVNPASDL